MKILIFTEGTILMHKSGENVDRKSRVKQSLTSEASISNYQSYIPISRAVSKITKWQSQGHQIYYLTSRTTTNDIQSIQNILCQYHFPTPQNLLYRQKHFVFFTNSYADVTAELMPDILIEDDCESIGGINQTISAHLKPNIKSQIKIFTVPEFGGIDHLPERI